MSVYPDYNSLPAFGPPGAYARVRGPNGAGDVYQWVAAVNGRSVGAWIPVEYAERIVRHVRDAGLTFPLRIVMENVGLWVGRLTFSDEGASPDRIVSTVADWTAMGVGPGEKVGFTGLVNTGQYLVASVATTFNTNDTLVLDPGETLFDEVDVVPLTAFIVGDNLARLDVEGFNYAEVGAGTVTESTGSHIRLNSVAAGTGNYARITFASDAGLGDAGEKLYLLFAKIATSGTGGIAKSLQRVMGSGGGGPVAMFQYSAPIGWRTGFFSIGGTYAAIGLSSPMPNPSAFSPFFLRLVMDGVNWKQNTASANLYSNPDRAMLCKAWNAETGPTEDSMALHGGLFDEGNGNTHYIWMNSEPANAGYMDIRNYHLFELAA